MIENSEINLYSSIYLIHNIIFIMRVICEARLAWQVFWVDCFLCEYRAYKDKARQALALRHSRDADQS